MNIRAVLVALLILFVTESEGQKKKICGEPPHSDECLLQIWEKSGCDPKGTHAPPNGPVDVWRMMDKKELSVSMKKYKKRAMSGYVDKETGTEYVTLCYGKEGGNCGPKSAPGPHTLSCLQQMWKEAKCFVTGTGYPVLGPKVKYWNSMPVGKVRREMRAIKKKALNQKVDKTGEPFVQICYGCGISNHMDEFIYLGSDVTDPQRWPWAVSIYSDNGLECNGAILSPKWVLTGADCLYNDEAGDLTVRMGVVDISGDGPEPVLSGVQRIITHEDYESVGSPFKVIHDMALLELTEEVELGQTIRPICLPRPGGKSYNKCHATGWGITETDGYGSDILQELKIQLVDDDECGERTRLSWISTGGVQCGEGESGGRLCHKDSGAPLVCIQGKNDYYVAVGVGSWWPKKCESSSYPHGFAQVDEKVRWIREKCNQCN